MTAKYFKSSISNYWLCGIILIYVCLDSKITFYKKKVIILLIFLYLQKLTLVLSIKEAESNILVYWSCRQMSRMNDQSLLWKQSPIFKCLSTVERNAMALSTLLFPRLSRHKLEPEIIANCKDSRQLNKVLWLPM